MGSRGKPAGGGESTGEYPISPLLERSTIDADGHLEVGVSVAGAGRVAENDLDVFLKRPRLSPGERIELGIFVSGLERVDETELSVFYDGERDELIDLEDPGTVRQSSNETATPSTAATDADASGADDSDVANADEESEPFVHPTTLDRGDPGEYALERKPLEGTDGGGPSYILEINTRAAAPTGSYSLPIVFTCRSEGGIKQIKKVRTVRLRSRRERWLPWVAGLALLGLLAAAAVQFGFF
ncbi:hypothetical protein [Halopiger xanaduensis]|uniref:DUF8164 domain-containing protein n=1 Tax=Halopiger xanaduensis (strain DSM 18323 / JCM 14033 / SH-6) TaxID=797210 RepID=F8DBC1_HALXS|nr:hypothetical protein [Halopiger xanaduensis]AEH35900.1 hypothetical protein Halxa_1267 [Halopiger xanaduensis SH-6]